MTRYYRVASRKHYHTVELVAFHSKFYLIGNKVTAWNFNITGIFKNHTVTNSSSHHFYGKPSCFTYTILNTLCKLIEMYMSRIVLIPGIYYTDKRATLFLEGITHSAHQTSSTFRSLTEFPVASHVFIFFLCHNFSSLEFKIHAFNRAINRLTAINKNCLTNYKP